MNGQAKTGPLREEGQRVPLRGNLGLRDAVEVCTRLREAVASFDTVEIDISGLTGLDISIVQLLLATGKSARRQGKALGLSGAMAPLCRDVLVRIGLLGPGGEVRALGEDFWLGQSPSQPRAAR